MVNCFRLIFSLFLVFYSSASFSAIDPVPNQWRIANSEKYYPKTVFSSLSEAAGSGIAAWNAKFPGFGGSCSPVMKTPTTASCNISCSIQSCGGVINFSAISSCPSNSSPSGKHCVCDAGYEEKNGACVLPEESDDPLCGRLKDTKIPLNDFPSNFGSQSKQWIGSVVGKTANSCQAGCQISGVVNGCSYGLKGGSSSDVQCYMDTPAFTGKACALKEEAGAGETSCPDGFTTDPASPGLCLPKQNTCPPGQSPSKYAQGVCIPDEVKDDGKCEDPADPSKRIDCEAKKSNCPPGYVSSNYAAGVCVPSENYVGKDKDGNIIECQGQNCTVKPGGDGTGGEGDQKTKDQICIDNPDLQMCQKKGAGLTGSCASNFTCDGDSVQCAIAIEQHKMNCKLTDTNNPLYAAYEKAANENASGTSALPESTVDLASHISTDSVIGQGACPADIEVMVFNQPIPLELSKFCPYFDAMGMLIIFGAALGCLRILGSG